MATIILTTQPEYHPTGEVPAVSSIIGDYIRETRIAAGFGVNALAHELGISAVYLSLIERGQRDPAPEVWRRIGQAVGCDMELLKRKYRLEAARRASEKWGNA